MKNLLLYSLVLCFVVTTPLLAQSDLYVQPNGGNSSYVFVKDQILFVTDDINLQANPTGATEASIYLRDEAQLIQGNDVGNSGTGSLSVYQESFGDAWDYNLWCSPVGNPTGAAGNTLAGMGRINDSIGGYTGANAGLNYTDALVNTPVVDRNGYTDPGNDPSMFISWRWIYYWNPVNQRWVYENYQNSIPAGNGFTMKGLNANNTAGNHTQRYDFRGRPNNGEIAVQIQRGDVPFSDGLTYRFAFTGNPYPSALNLYRVAMDPDNWDDPLDPTTAKIDSFRFWEEDINIDSHLYIDNKGGYATWIPGADENDPGTYTAAMFLNYDGAGNPSGGSTGSGGNYERLNSPIGQGFMIVGADDGTTGSSTDVVLIRNSHRRYIKEGIANNSQFRTTTGNGGPSIGTSNSSQSGGTSTNTSNKSMLRLHTYFNEGSHYRDIVLLFDSNSTDGYDGLKDASHPMDAVSGDVYYPIDQGTEYKRNLVIQSVPYTDHDKMIPIAFRIGQTMEINPVIAEELNPPYGKAYLYDNETNIYHELKMMNSSGSSTATGGIPTNPLANSSAKITLGPGTYENRFFITFRGDKPSDDDSIVAGFDGGSGRSTSTASAVDFFQNNPSKQLEVMNPDRLNVQQVAIYDMTGKMVISQDNLGTNDRFIFPTHNFSDGVYLVLLTTTDNLRFDYKINVFNK